MHKGNLPVQLTVALSSNRFIDCDIDAGLILSIKSFKLYELIGSGEYAGIFK